MLSIKTYAAILTDVAFATDEDPDGAVKERYLHAAVMQNSPASTRAEVPLGELGARQAWEDGTGRVDVVIGTHGIELKVLAFPRVGATPSNALYDVGQLASDYWRLQNAKKLQSGELLLLLHGPLVPALASGTAIYRELHNRMFVDFETSLRFGELHREKAELKRVRQMSAIRAMQLDGPYGPGTPKGAVTVNGKFALVSIPVVDASTED